MEKNIINVHSVIDIITNSSTEIFMSATNEATKNVKDIVDAVLKASGSDKTCDDLFVVTRVPTESAFEMLVEKVYETIGDGDAEEEDYEGDELVGLFSKDVIEIARKSEGDDDGYQLLVKELKKLADEGKIDWTKLEEQEEQVEFTVQIQTKNGEDLELAEKIFELFSAEERYQ